MDKIKFEIFEKAFDKVDLSKAELARMLGARPNALQGWFERKSVPSKYLYPVAEALEVNPRYLLGETDDATRMQIIPILGNASSVETFMSNIAPKEPYKTIERHYFGKSVYGILADADCMQGIINKGSLCLCSPSTEVKLNDVVHYTYGDQSGIARYRLSADKKTIVLAHDNSNGNGCDPIFIGWDSEIELKMVKIIRVEQDL